MRERKEERGRERLSETFGVDTPDAPGHTEPGF